ncbi:MAG: Na+/H+ antiporter NhaC family protein [Muribaculum sp.]|nr:Na+/H+ antiporter NhaC family protein [Muribaculum sp.]
MIEIPTIDTNRRVPTAKGLLALTPVMLFLILYVAVSVVIGDFYKMPISVALVVASVWAVMIYRGGSLLDRIEVFSRAAGHFNILYMIWVFVLAGAFATLAKEIGAVDATVQFALRVFPPEFVVPTLFFASCFISLSIGTSVGTVVALTPLAVEMAQMAGAQVPFYVAVVLGGAFFGDNLSFISDTTIAATRSQGCNMGDKFKANLWIALPAAIVTLGAYIIMSDDTPEIRMIYDSNPWLILPYIIVIVTAVIGINVTVVLSLGIVTALVMGIIDGHSMIELAGLMGSGIDSMGNLIIITLLAAGMLGLIKAAGGIQYLLQTLTAHISGTRGAQSVLALLVGLVNLCTANNTVAIITVGGIARDVSERYGIDPRKSASLLDSASCVVQCLIPYGAQTLLATSLAGISPASPFPYLYYPWVLALMILLSILFQYPRYLAKQKRTSKN